MIGVRKAVGASHPQETLVKTDDCPYETTLSLSKGNENRFDLYKKLFIIIRA